MKKIILLLCTLVMIFSATACKKGGIKNIPSDRSEQKFEVQTMTREEFENQIDSFKGDD